MNLIQMAIDGLNESMQRERMATQMTLGKLIAALESMPPDVRVLNLCKPHSYRGYYCDLAFELGEGSQPTSMLLTTCRGAMGKLFEGYKGGQFLMGESTPLWVSSWGNNSGDRLMSLAADGSVTTAKEED